MKINREAKWISGFIIVSLMVFLVYRVVAGNGDGKEPLYEGEPGWEELPEGVPVSDSESVTGAFFARVEQQHDIHQPHLFEVEVKVLPALGEWPGIGFDVRGSVTELNLHTWVVIRGITVPSSYTSRERPHQEVEFERRRFDKAMDFVWQMLKGQGYVVLENPVWLAGKESVSTAGVYACDVFVFVGGMKISLADILVRSGHAKRGKTGDFDWGSPHVVRIGE